MAAAAYFGAVTPEAPSVIALYHPTGDELDTAPLAERLMRQGHAVVLPVVIGKRSPLVFRLFEIDRPLQAGPYGILAPDEDAPVHRPDIVVTPLLAVRKADGARLGMGGGYYDRTLSALRSEGPVTAIGFGYEAQVMERFPVAPHDVPLNGFISEAGPREFNARD